MTPRIAPTTLRRASLIAIAALALSAIAAGPGEAQILRVPRGASTRSPVFFEADIGFLGAARRFDSPSGTDWSFGEGIQWRGGIGFGRTAGSVMLSGSTARIPVSVNAVRGDVDLRTLMLSFRSPEGQGAHQVVEFGAGMAQWTNLATDVPTTGAGETRSHFLLDVAYGFGLSIGTNASLSLVQDFAMVIGGDGGAASDASRFQQVTTTRIGLRLRF